MWRENHQSQGRSDIHRTGRFGIGLLAAFLLGEELLVETRYYNQPENKALRFRCKKSDQAITVTNCKMHIGTKIVIKINNRILNQLSKNYLNWDWFTLETPKVKRLIIKEDEKAELKQKISVPNSKSELLDNGWYRIDADGFDDVIWTYHPLSRTGNHYGKNILVCNGIFVREGLNEYKNSLDFDISGELKAFEVKTPTLVIYDQDGELPLNLQRNDLLTNKLQFHESLTKSLANYAAKKMHSFSKGLININIDKNTISAISQFNFDGMEAAPYHYSIGSMSKFIISDKHLMPLDFWVLKQGKLKSLYLDGIGTSATSGMWLSEEFASNCTNYLPVKLATNSKGDKSQWVRTFFEMRAGYASGKTGLNSLPVIGKRILIRHEDLRLITGNGYVPVTFVRRLINEWSNDEWALYKIGSVPILEFNLEKILIQLGGKASFGFIGYYFDWGRVKEVSDSPFSEAWREVNRTDASD